MPSSPTAPQTNNSLLTVGSMPISKTGVPNKQSGTYKSKQGKYCFMPLIDGQIVLTFICGSMLFAMPSPLECANLAKQ
ncbi:hypothetical protein ACHAXS_001557 [Conticribra weissflogii]